jgi:hypothetical protein
LEPVITAEIESAAGYRDPGNAMWLGMLPGAGHFYIGNNRKGTILAGLGAGFALLLAKGYSDPLDSSGYATIGGLGLSLTMGYSSWSAYQDAYKHNDALRRTAVILHPHREGGVAVGITVTH